MDATTTKGPCSLQVSLFRAWPPRCSTSRPILRSPGAAGTQEAIRRTGQSLPSDTVEVLLRSTTAALATTAFSVNGFRHPRDPTAPAHPIVTVNTGWTYLELAYHVGMVWAVLYACAARMPLTGSVADAPGGGDNYLDLFFSTLVPDTTLLNSVFPRRVRRLLPRNENVVRHALNRKGLLMRPDNPLFFDTFTDSVHVRLAEPRRHGIHRLIRSRVSDPQGPGIPRPPPRWARARRPLQRFGRDGPRRRPDRARLVRGVFHPRAPVRRY
jgi:hypothetical protein